jgi:hypothetical protein
MPLILKNGVTLVGIAVGSKSVTRAVLLNRDDGFTPPLLPD